jgi:hypothetical protein
MRQTVRVPSSNHAPVRSSPSPKDRGQGLRDVRLWPDDLLSVNPLPLAQRPQTDEPDLPLHLRLNGLSREPNLPANPRPVTHVELAKAIELQCESIRAQMIEQSGVQARDHGIDDVLSLFLGRQGQSSLNPHGQLVSTF